MRKRYGKARIMYRVSESFRDCIGRYCKKHEVDVKTAFTHSMVKSLGSYYMAKERGGKYKKGVVAGDVKLLFIEWE